MILEKLMYHNWPSIIFVPLFFPFCFAFQIGFTKFSSRIDIKISAFQSSTHQFYVTVTFYTLILINNNKNELSICVTSALEVEENKINEITQKTARTQFIIEKFECLFFSRLLLYSWLLFQMHVAMSQITKRLSYFMLFKNQPIVFSFIYTYTIFFCSLFTLCVDMNLSFHFKSFIVVVVVVMVLL